MKAYQIAIELTGKVNGNISSASNSVATSLGALSDKVKTLNAAQSKLSDAQKLKGSLSETLQKYRESQSAIANLKTAYSEQKVKLQEMQNAYKAALANTVALRDALGAEKITLSELQLAYKSNTGDRASLQTQIVAQKEAVRKATDEYKNSVSVAKEVGVSLNNVRVETSASKKELDGAKKSSQKLREDFSKQHEKLSALRTEMAKAGISGKNLALVQNQIATAAQRATAAQERLRNSQAKLNAVRERMSLNSLQAEVAPVMALGGALYTTVKSAAAFESTMAGIKKVVDFDSPEEFKQTSKDLQELSLRIPMTTKQLGEIYAAGGQGNIAKKDLLGFTETAAKMGVAFDVSAEQAGAWMAKWRSALGMNQEQVVELADQINYLGNNSAANAAQISSVVSRIGALGKVGNVTGSQIAAMGATIIGAGQSEEIAATGIKNFMLALTSGASATKTQVGAFAQLRIDPEKLAGEMMKDPEKVMVGVLERIAEVKPEQRASLLGDLFGKESIAAIAPMLSNIGAFKKNLALTKNGYAGSMEKEFESMAGTATNSFELIKNSADVIQQTLGTSLLPVVKELSAGAVSGARAFGEFAQAHPKLIEYAVKLVAAGAALKVFRVGGGFVADLIRLPYLTAANSINKLRAAYDLANGSLVQMGKNTTAYKLAAKGASAAQWLWNGAMTAGRWLLDVGKLIAYKVYTLAVSAATKLWSAAQWVLNAALNANPIGLTITVIAGLVAVMSVLYQKFEGVRNVVDATWGVLKGAGNAVVAFFGGGGEISAPKMASVPAHAAGGIFNRPHIGMVADGKEPESIIPWNSRGRSIWEMTGEQNNWNTRTSTFSPNVTINVQGGTPETGKNVANEVERALQRLAHERERRSFA
ncbi:phage tail tape measure protein [Cloacibacillus sp.]